MTTGTTSSLTTTSRASWFSIPPFGDGANIRATAHAIERMLDQCLFAPTPTLSVSDASTHLLDPDTLHKPIEPRFVIVIPPDALDDLILESGDLELAISVVSSHLRRYDLLDRWPLTSCPSPWEPTVAALSHFQSGRGMDFVMSVRVASDRKELSDQGFSRGTVVSRKVFSVKQPTIMGFFFPTKWFDFGGPGYPKEALWVIDWFCNFDNEDDEEVFNRPADELLMVQVNSAAEATLNKMDDALGKGMATKMLGTEILTQIFSDVITHMKEDPTPGDTSTLAYTVLDAIQKVSGMDFGTIRSELKPDADQGHRRLRNYVAQTTELVN